MQYMGVTGVVHRGILHVSLAWRGRRCSTICRGAHLFAKFNFDVSFVNGVSDPRDGAHC